MDFLKGANLGGVASQVGSAVAQEGQKQMVREKLGPLVKKIHPVWGEKILEQIMKLDITKLLSMLDNEKELKQQVDEEAKKIEKEEGQKPRDDIKLD